MNVLSQGETLLIGSQEAIDALARKDTANIIVASDSHGSPSVLKSILMECGAFADALVFCGDGAADIMAMLAKLSAEEDTASCLPAVIAIVQGNCDTAEYRLHAHNDAIIKVPLYQVLCVCGHIVFCTHGHHFSLYSGTQQLEQAAAMQHASIILYGHTHIACARQEGNILLLNPGSCAKPRGGQPPCYAHILIKKDSEKLIPTFHKITGTKSICFIPDSVQF